MARWSNANGGEETMTKRKTLRCYIVLGNDDSIIDGPYWYRDGLTAKWDTEDGTIKIVRADLTYPAPKTTTRKRR